MNPCVIYSRGRWLCCLMDDIYPRPPVAYGINGHEAYAEWRVLAKLAGGIL